MTSTNDGKDVKSNQTSGHKSKSYYIELYTSLEKALSGEGSLEERTTHVCEAWRRVYSLYQHSATSTHPHLLSWLQRHTANTVLQSKWAKSKNEHSRLTEAIDALVAEATAAATGREQHPWETLLLQRAAWFRKAVENPWDNEVLKSLINPNSEPVTDQQVLEWLISEHGVVLVTRLQRMVGAGNCDDLALLLASAVMDRARAAVQPRDEQAHDEALEETHKSFVAVLERDASFTADEWEMLTDIELVLLLKTDKQPRCIELAKLLPLRHGYKMVERLRKRLEMSPRDKKLWKHAKEVAKLVAQVIIARCMVLPSCSGAGRDALYWCARALARLEAGAALRPVSTAMARLAATARHLHTFCAALSAESKELQMDDVMKPFICELYIRAITAGMDELAQLKLNAEKESEARLYEQTLAGWFTQLGGRLTGSARLRAECALTAFSVHPARKHYERVAATPPPPRLQQAQEPTPETTSEYGSWANDSRTQSNLVKTSETLQLKQSQQHQANVLSTAILTEGEALGLETVLCNDLAVLLSGPRVKTLSWDMDREVLLENCRAYMEKTQGGTRAVTTELKFLNLDPDQYSHLPEEGDDESDLYYGIEKGYEHEVQLEEPEDIWQNAFFDPEQTESAHDSEVESQTKKKTKPVSSEDDEDPLSNIAEAKREKKLAKEKRKEQRKKKSEKRDDSKDRSRERRKDKDKKTKKERKKDKSEQPTTGSLTSLLGMKVTKMSAQVQDGEKRVRKKKERRREVPNTAMFSYVGVTDSDYDSQGKSSHEHDPNVLVDGVFSMDDIRSPERRLSIDSQKPIDNIKNTIKTSANVQRPVINDITRPNPSSPLVSTTASEDSDADKQRIRSETRSKLHELMQFRLNKLSKNQTQSLVGLKIYNPDEIPIVNPDKKQNKQLETVRKDSNNSPVLASSISNSGERSDKLNSVQKSSLPHQHSNPMRHTLPSMFSESQKRIDYTQHSPIKSSQPMAHHSPSSVIQTNYTSPSKTPDHPLNLSPPKPTITYQPFHKSMQNLSTDVRSDPPKKPLLINDPNYFSQQHKNASQLSPRIISNTCIKPPSQTATTQQYTATVKNKKSLQSRNLQRAHTPRVPEQHLLNSDFIRCGQKQLSSSMQNINEMPGRYEVGKRLIPTPNDVHSNANAKLYSVTSQSVASNSSQSSRTNNSTASRCVPFQNQRLDTKPKPDINTDFNEYLKDLVKQSMAASNTHGKNVGIALNKDVKMTAVMPNTSVRNTTQSAKQTIQQKKTENAPNTFSRRSYMHKNKQSENKLNITDTVTMELNRTILDHKISKAKCSKNEVTISRVGSNTQESGKVIRKLDQPASRLQKNCPVLSGMLDSSSPSKIPTPSSTNTSHNTTGSQANREDADLLLLLRHQTVLNHNVSNAPTSSDVTSTQTSTQQYKADTQVSSSSPHQTLVGTKVQNLNVLDNTPPLPKESETLEWRRVMDAIIAQKTQSTLGPNALDLALKREYRSGSQSLRGPGVKSKVPVQGTLNKTSELKKRDYSSKTGSASHKPRTEITTKKPREHEVIKKTQITEVVHKTEIHHNKHVSSSMTKDVPQTTVIPNSDYDLDDLLDDDLRRELGEISSDEDNYNTANAPMSKVKTHSNIPKTVPNVYKGGNIAKEKPHINPKSNVHKKETNSSVVDSYRRIAAHTSTTIGYPNVITNASPQVIIHSENNLTIVNSQRARHDSATTIISNQVAQETANNIVTSHIEASHFISNIAPTNVILASVPVSQPPVVVIRQDLIYDPFPTIRIHESQINTQLCAANQNMFAINTAPNIALYQTTQYAAPVINPIIIGNAITSTDVSSAEAMTKDHVAPDSTVDANNEDEDRISLETAIRLTDIDAEVNSQAADVSKNVDFNMNRNSERKVLSQVQEKHPNDNVGKDCHLANLARSLEERPFQTKEEKDRIKLKRESLMNRKISHAGYHPPIPLTYAPLTKKLIHLDSPRNGFIKHSLKSIPVCTSEADKYIAESTNVESPQSESNNENIETSNESPIPKGNLKCRRIWLRSSNKIPTKKSPIKRPRVPLKRNKVKEKQDTVAETVLNVENENKDIVKNPTRVSSRILNKVKHITPETNDSSAQEETQEIIPDGDELIDFEEALNSSIVLKTGVEIEKKTGDETESEQDNSSGTVVEQRKELDSIGSNTKLIPEPNKTSDIRLEPKVMIEKLKSKLGNQIIIKKSPVKAVKVVAVKNLKRAILRNKSNTGKRLAPKESLATSSNGVLKIPSETSSTVIRSQGVLDKSNKLLAPVIGDQKVTVKTTEMNAPHTTNNSKPVISTVQKVIPQNAAVRLPSKIDESQPSAFDDQKVNEAHRLATQAIQTGPKNTSSTGSLPTNDESNKVKPIIVDDKVIIDTTPLEVKTLPPVDDKKSIDQIAGSQLCHGESNTLKSTILEETTPEYKPTVIAPRDIVENNTSTSNSLDQDLIKEIPLDSLSAATEQKTNNNASDNMKKSEIKNNLTHTNATTIALETTVHDEKTSTETVANMVTETKVNKEDQEECKTNTNEILSHTQNIPLVNVEVNKQTDTKPALNKSLETCDVVNTKLVQKDSETIDAPEEELVPKIENDDPAAETVTNKDGRINNSKSSLLQGNDKEIVKDRPSSNDVKEKQMHQYLTEKLTNLREQMNDSKPNKLNDNRKRLEELKSLTASNDGTISSKLTSATNKNKSASMKNDIKKIEELPAGNSKDPLKKLVRITLSNGKVFRATISGKINGDFESLFAEPTVRAILAAGNINDGKHFTVNYKQVITANKDNPNKVLATKIHELNIKELKQQPPPIDTVNLISDDEDEIPSPSRSFNTEFGKYTTNIDEEAFNMHQKKFDQKCEVRMHENRNDMFKSNRTKPKRKRPAVQSTLLTRNKSKMLPIALSTTDTISDIIPKIDIIPKTDVIPKTDIIPNTEIIPQTDIIPWTFEETCSPSVTQEGGTICTPVFESPNVIEIDDSSNDSIDSQTPKPVENIPEPVKKIFELKDLLLQDLGVQTNNIPVPLQKEKAVDNLKSALLLDLGIATQNPVIDITADDEKEVVNSTETKNVNKECDNNIAMADTKQICEKDDKSLNKHQDIHNLRKCSVKLVKCDNLIRKYESMKKCYVVLERLNNFPKAATTHPLDQKPNNETTVELETTKNDEIDDMSHDAEDFIEFDVDEPSGSPQLSRCPSLSILNNWDDDSQPYLERPCRSSPVMEIYDLIAQLRNRQETEIVREPNHILSFTCDFEWTVTKLGYSIQEKLLRTPETTKENKMTLTNRGNIMLSNPENLTKLHYPPKLLTTTLEFLEKNPELIHQLQSIRRWDRILTRKTSTNKLKRKTREVVRDTAASKILKLGTLALNTLNSCIKVFDAIVLNDKPSSNKLPDIKNNDLDEAEIHLNAPSEENNKYSSATAHTVPLNEESNSYLEESDLAVDSNMNMTGNETEDEYAEAIQSSGNSPPEINDTTDLYPEETMLIPVSIMSPAGNKPEGRHNEMYDSHCSQSGNEEILVSDDSTSSLNGDKTKENSESDLTNICDDETNATDLLPLAEKKEDCVRPTIVIEETNAYSDNVNPSGKNEENSEEENSCDGVSIKSETDQRAQGEHNQGSTISESLVSEESNIDKHTIGEYDMKATDCGNVMDVMDKEKSEPDLVTETCDESNTEVDTNTCVNANLSIEHSIANLPSKVDSIDEHLSEKNIPETGDPKCVRNCNETVISLKDNVQLNEVLIDEFPNAVYEVEIVDTHIDNSIDIVETLNETSHHPITNEDVPEVNNHDSLVKSPVFIDTKKIAFNYHDYTKLPKNKEENRTNPVNSRHEAILVEKTDRDLISKECGSKNDCEDARPNHNEENVTDNGRLKSNPECKYELIQEDDLLTVKITNESANEDNEAKTVFVGPNETEDDAVIVAALRSNDADDAIDIKGYEFEDMYVFPLSQSTCNSNTSSDSLGQEFNSTSVNNSVQDNLHDIDYRVIEPEMTYSRKRKISMRDVRVPAKKYRKGKNIDCYKQTETSRVELAYAKEYKRLLDYCSSVKFSYTRPFHKDCVEAEDVVGYWTTDGTDCDIPDDVGDDHLFVDIQAPGSYQPDPATQTFVEEISYDYYKTDATQDQIIMASEVNFNMGFGEGSGRVIQILKKGESNISAATLSDVKQAQPVLKSEKQDDYNSLAWNNDDQIEKIREHVKFIGLRDKVRTFFKNLTQELKNDWSHKRKAEPESKCDGGLLEEFPYDLCSLDYLNPLPTDTIVQVVQVGQLPVSAAAQNPVTCDPRVTQVSDASPSQCSVDNSPNDDSQSEIKTEYTELTTADLTLPLQEYAQQNQASLASQDNLELTEQTISLEMEIKAEESPQIKEEMPDIKEEKSNSSDTDLHTLSNATSENLDYSFDKNTEKATGLLYDSSEQNSSETFSQQRQQNGTSEKTDQIAHAMNAAGITTTPETITNTRAHALVNILSQKIRQGSINTTQTTTNTYSKTTSINAMALQQALAQILPPPLNQTGSSDNNQAQSTPVGPQVLHIVQGKNASGNQITLVDNSQQSVISNPNTQVLHIVQNKNATPGQASNGTLTSQGNSFSGLSLVDAGLQQGGNQLLHIVNTGNQKNANAGQLLKRVNLLTNLTNVQGSNEQKMVQFVCKSADGKAIQLNAPHQRSMVLRLQPIETPNVQTPSAKPAESQELSPSPTSSASAKDSASQQEIKSRSIYEENYAKFIQNSSSKIPGLEKSTSLPKFNQAFGKPVFQEGQKQGEAASNNSHMPPVNSNSDNSECPATDNAINLEHIGQISSPPLLLRKQPVVTTQSQPNIVQQIKQTIAPMNIQTMHGGVIYTRQIPVNIGGGQTINLITVPSTELINDDNSKTQTQTNQGEIEPSIIKIVPQSQTTTNTESSQEESNNHASGSSENNPAPQPQPVLTQMRIKLPMLSKAPQMVPGARVVRPSFFQIQRNVIGGANQPVYQQLVLTAAPPLGQQTIRLPAAQASRPVKTPSESQSSSSESQMSTSTLEQLREFDMVLEQVKERSTVQPSTNTNNNSFKIHTTSSDTTDGNASSNCSTESTSQVLYSIGSNQSLNVAYVNRKTTVTTPTTSTYVRSPDSTGIADSPTSSTHVQIPHTVTTDSSPTEMSSQSKPAKVGSKSKSRPKSTSNPPNTLKLNSVPPKTSSQKPLEDEQTTQRILYILAEYKEQVENSPDKDKPAPRRRSNPPSNPGSSKRKKSSSSRRSGTRDMSPVHGEDTCRTMGSEDSSCGTSQGDCTESCLDSHSPQDSPRKVARKITFDQELTVTQPRPQPQRNVIVADGQTITVARGTTGKPATAVLMPANYILPVSMVKGGQQIAIVTNRGPKLLTVGGEGGATNALLLQRLIGPAGLKPVLARPGVRHVRLPTAALHNLQAFNLATATTVQPPDSTASPTPGPTPPELVDTRANSSPWTDRDEVKPERGSSPEGSEPWNLPSSADPHEYSYEETVRTDNMDRTVLVVQKKDGSQRQHRLAHVSAAALRHKYAILEHELRLQKSLSEECEDLGVDSPSASELFPEAELLFAASPAHEHNQEHHSHTPQPHQSSIPQPDMDDQIATDHLIPRSIDSLGLGDVGIVAVSEDGSATIALDQEEFARSHPNTTFHSEPTEGEVQPFTITGLKGRHITSTIFHSNSAPATVLMTAPQATVISQAPDHSVKYEIENMINSMPSSHNDINLSSVLVKDDGLTRFDNILTDSRELHLTNTTSAIVHSSGNATQVIRRVCYEDDKRERDARYLIDEPDNLIAGDDAKMIAEDSSRDATLESMADVDDDRSSPERHAELFWESNSASERSESRRPLDFSSDSDKCCKSPSFDETNSTDSSGVGTHMRLDSVIKEARGRERSGSADGSSADDAVPPLRTYPPKRPYQPHEAERSLSGKTRAGEAETHELRRRASGRGVVKRGCHCCNGEPAAVRPKKPRVRKPTLDFHATN